MGFFENLFGKFHITKYKIEKYAECQEFLTKHDVFMTVSDTCIYHVTEGMIEVGTEYIESCKAITKYEYEKLIQGGTIRNIYFIPSP